MVAIEAIPITNPPDEVTDDATHFSCAAGLSGLPGFSVFFAGSAGLRPASYSHLLAKKAISGPLEPVEQERQGAGRPPIPKEVRDLIRRMSQANPMWGSPRILRELRKLGIEVAKSTVENYRLPPQKPPMSPGWKTFLRNHVKDLVSLDFFVVATVKHKVLLVLLILAHDRRRVVHFNLTEHPTAQ